LPCRGIAITRAHVLAQMQGTHSDHMIKHHLPWPKAMKRLTENWFMSDRNRIFGPDGILTNSGLPENIQERLETQIKDQDWAPIFVLPMLRKLERMFKVCVGVGYEANLTYRYIYIRKAMFEPNFLKVLQGTPETDTALFRLFKNDLTTLLWNQFDSTLTPDVIEVMSPDIEKKILAFFNTPTYFNYGNKFSLKTGQDWT
jgi:hypothetical protein